MCGRFTLKSPRRVASWGTNNSALPPAMLVPRYNIAPSQEILGITEVNSQRQVSAFLWGLIPSGSKEPKGFINARAETLEVKPSFRESFERRRCLIPADGFYEWSRNGKSKQAHYFQLKNESPFAFAGIWDRWQRGSDSITSCSIITTTPNELLATIHHRMPVMLAPEAQDRWLSDSGCAQLMELLVPFPAKEMKSFPVSLEVNHSKTEGPSLVQPAELIEEPENLRLF